MSQGKSENLQVIHLKQIILAEANRSRRRKRETNLNLSATSYDMRCKTVKKLIDVENVEGEVDFRVLQERVLAYAQKMGFFKDVEGVDSQTIFEFLITLLEQGLVPKRQPINIDDVIRSHMAMFLDWFFLKKSSEAPKQSQNCMLRAEISKKTSGMWIYKE